MRTRMLISVLLVTAMLAAGAPSIGAEPARSNADLGPALAVTSPANRSVTNEPTVTVTGSTNATSVVVAANEETIPAQISAEGTFSAQVILRRGPNAIVVVARSDLGETTVTRRVTLDQTPPKISSLVMRRAVFSVASRSRRRIAQYRVTEKVHVAVTVTSRVGRRLRVFHRYKLPARRRGVQLWNGRVARGRLVKPGIYRLRLVARDLAGNTATRTARFRVVVRKDTLATRIVRTAMSLRGVRYVWGGSSPRGFDCSGFVGYVYSRHGISLPRVSRDQARVGRRVPLNRLRPADILAFNMNGSGVSHVGIYIGRGLMVNASSGRGGVVVASVRPGTYYWSRLVTARRLVR